MGKKETPAAMPEAPETNTVPADLGVLTEQPTVKRKPVKTKLDDGTLRTDY